MDRIEWVHVLLFVMVVCAFMGSSTMEMLKHNALHRELHPDHQTVPKDMVCILPEINEEK